MLAGLLGQELAAFGESVAGTDAVATAAARVDEFLTGRVPYLRGGLTDLVGLSALADTTRLEHRPTATCVLRPDGGTLRVLLGDRELRMPVRLTEVMAFVRDSPAFEVGELAPWLDPESRLVVARRLVREGLLRIAT